MPELLISALGMADAPALAGFFSADPPEYHRFFAPFPFDEASLAAMLSAAKRDRYFGVRLDGLLVAFFMLRGWDAGYSVPAFGVVVRGSMVRSGLSRLCLDYAMTWCRLGRIPRMMLKCHPENSAAKALYESSRFTAVGEDPGNGNVIYQRDL